MVVVLGYVEVSWGWVIWVVLSWVGVECCGVGLICTQQVFLETFFEVLGDFWGFGSRRIGRLSGGREKWDSSIWSSWVRLPTVVLGSVESSWAGLSWVFWRPFSVEEGWKTESVANKRWWRTESQTMGRMSLRSWGQTKKLHLANGSCSTPLLVKCNKWLKVILDPLRWSYWELSKNFMFVCGYIRVPNRASFGHHNPSVILW